MFRTFPRTEGARSSISRRFQSSTRSALSLDSEMEEYRGGGYVSGCSGASRGVAPAKVDLFDAGIVVMKLYGINWLLIR